MTISVTVVGLFSGVELLRGVLQAVEAAVARSATVLALAAA